MSDNVSIKTVEQYYALESLAYILMISGIDSSEDIYDTLTDYSKEFFCRDCDQEHHKCDCNEYDYRYYDREYDSDTTDYP